MKWIVLAGIIGLTTSCCTITKVIGYRQVSLIPVKRVAVTSCCPKIVPVNPVVTHVVSPVVKPALIDYVEPVDVTTTTINFY